jgi:hypothetical protein
LPHLAGIFRLATTELCCIIVPTASDSIATPSSPLFTIITITAFVTDPPCRASVRSPTREEHIYGIKEIGHTIRLKFDIFFVRCDGTRPPYSNIVVIVSIVRSRNATEPKAQQYP